MQALSVVSSKRTFYVPPMYLRNERPNKPQNTVYIDFDHRLQLNEQVRVPLCGVTSMTLQAIEPVPSAESLRWQDFDPYTDEFSVTISIPEHPFTAAKVGAGDALLCFVNLMRTPANGTSPFGQLVNAALLTANGPAPRMETFTLTLKGAMSGAARVTKIVRTHTDGNTTAYEHSNPPVIRRLPVEQSREDSYLYEKEPTWVTSDLWAEALAPVVASRGAITTEYSSWNDDSNQLEGKQRREGGDGEFTDRLNYVFKLCRPDHLFDQTVQARMGFGASDWQEYYYYMITYVLNQLRVSVEPDTGRVFAQIRLGPVMLRLVKSLSEQTSDKFLVRNMCDEWVCCRLAVNVNALTQQPQNIEAEFDLAYQAGATNVNNMAQGPYLCQWDNCPAPLPGDTGAGKSRRWNLVVGMTALCRAGISSPFMPSYRLLGLAHESHSLTAYGHPWVNEFMAKHQYNTGGYVDGPDTTAYTTDEQKKLAMAHFNFVATPMVWDATFRGAANLTTIAFERISPAHWQTILSDVGMRVATQLQANGYYSRSMFPLVMDPAALVNLFASKMPPLTEAPHPDPMFATLVPRMKAINLWYVDNGDFSTQPSPWRLAELERGTVFLFLDTQAGSTMSILTTNDFESSNAANQSLENQSFLNLVAAIDANWKVLYSAPIELPPGTNFQTLRIVMKNVYGQTVRLRGELAFYFTMQTDTQQSVPYV